MTVGEWIDYYLSYPVVGIITIKFLTLEVAREIIHRCQEDGDSFAELKRQYEARMVTKKEIVRYFVPSTIPFAPHTHLAFNMKRDSVSNPLYISFHDKYIVFKVNESIPSKVKSFTLVHDEIRKNKIHSFIKKDL